jgi:hypothetical protein
MAIVVSDQYKQDKLFPTLANTVLLALSARLTPQAKIMPSAKLAFSSKIEYV